MDNFEDNLPAGQRKLLSLIGNNHNTIYRIAHLTNRARSNVCKSLNKLLKKGLIDRRFRGLYYLTSLGLDVINHSERKPTTTKRELSSTIEGLKERITPSTKKYGERVRLHDVVFKINLRRIPQGWEENRRKFFNIEVAQECFFNDLFRGGGISQFIIDDYRVWCYTKSVRVYVPQVVADSPEEATRRVFLKFLEFIPKLERYLCLPREALVKSGRLNVELSSAHYALMKNEFAQWTNKKRERFAVYDDNKRIRLLVDKSFFDEFEAVTPDHGEEDISETREHFKDIIEGRALRPRAVKEGLEDLTEAVGGLVPSIVELKEVNVSLAENIRSHLLIIDNMKEAAESLNQALSPIRYVYNFFSSLGGRS